MSRRTTNSTPQIQSVRRSRRGRKPIRLAFERLEDRTMLDASPEATVPIVVGRVLSSYFAGGVQNNQETITYTVYNNQADTETGVLLTTTLASGVSFASASQPPDQSGQNLAWSLGTLGGFDRASVSITVSLATPAPTQLDSGAQAFAMLDGGSVTASTPAATLRSGNLSDPSLLASTPDANTTDPFVQEEAAALDYDPQKIFDFLHTQVGYNSYLGSVRGARGTLWSMAGNALDVASLGVALMRASGISAQYEQGTLSQAQAQQLILSMFPPTFQTVGFAPADTQTADPAKDPRLLAETESHFWFQFDAGSGMQDADPLMQGATVGQSFTPSTGSFSEVPDSLREKTEIQLSAEFLSELDEFFGSGLSTQTVLDQTFNDVDLVGHPLTIGNIVGTDVEGLAGINQETYTYTAYIALGDEAFPDLSHDTTITGTPYQEIYTNFELGSQELTGLFLSVTLSGPQGPAQTFQHTILDRIGFAARQDPSGLNLVVPDSNPPAFTDADLTTVNVLPGIQSPNVTQPQIDYLTALQAQLNQQNGGSDDVVSDTGQSADALTNFGIGFTRLVNAQVAVWSDVLSAELATADNVAAYFHRPRVIVASQSVTQDQSAQTGTISTTIDLLADQIRAIPAPGQATYGGYVFNLTRGYTENAVESQVAAAGGSASSDVSAGQILIDARQQGITVTALFGADAIAQLDSYGLDPDATARIAAALNAGQIVVVPTSPVTINGQQTTGWFQTDPTTGFTTGVLPNGGHEGVAELVVASAIEGLLFGIAVGVSAATYRIYVVRSFLPGISNPTPEEIQAAKKLADQADQAAQSSSTSTSVDILSGGGVAGGLLSSLFAIVLGAQTAAARAEAADFLIRLLSNKSITSTFDAIIFYNTYQARSIMIGQLEFLLAPGLGLAAAAFLELTTGFLAFAIGNEVGFHAFTYLFLNDPPVEPLLSAVATPIHASPNVAHNTTASTATVAAGQAGGNARVPSVAANGNLSATWNSTSTSAVQLTSLSAPSAVVVDANGKSVGSGTIALSASAPVPASVSGSNAYSATGTGTLSFYGPAESSLGVSGNWTSYSANVTGNAVAITLTSDSLTLNGQTLPADTYTITTSTAALAGSGQTTSPDFASSASLNLAGGTVTLGPEKGTITLGGKPLDLSSGTTFDGYTGGLTVTANANGDDTVTLSGNAANVLTVSATPATLTTDQNTPVTFQAHVNTSLADTYNLTAQAPPGWTVAIDSRGKVTATPAPGLQGGTFPIEVIAQSTTDPNLVAQTTVNVTITPTRPGITLAVQPDPLLTVPFNGAELPTAFQAIVHNSGPAADTFNLALTNLPAGFSLEQGAPSVTIPAGQTGIVGLYVVPTGDRLPPAGTTASFTVTATSTSDPSITKSVVESFTVPAIDSVTLSASPAQASTTPGTPATATITLTNNGNVSEDVTLTSSGQPGLKLAGLAPITVAAGQTATETITLTPAQNAAVNTTLAATITATFGPATSPQTTTAEVDVLVQSAQGVAIAQASVAAGQGNNTQLAQTLNDLSNAVNQLQNAPTDPSALAQVQFVLGNLSLLLSADPTLAPSVPQLQAIQADATAGDTTDLLAAMPAFFMNLSGTLTAEAAEQFTIAVSPNDIDLHTGQPLTVTVTLTNTGTDPVTLNLTATGLPAAVTAAFAQTQVTLAPGASTTDALTLSQSQDTNTAFNLEVTAAATVVQQTAAVEVTTLPAVADVVGVTVTPQAVSAGAPVSIKAQIFNTANVTRDVLAQVQILDPAGHPISAPPPVPVSLVPATGNITVDLGQVATTGLADGVYSVEVGLFETDGTPLPGLTAEAVFGVGQPVTATVIASPAVVPPGTSTVTTTIQVTNSAGEGSTSMQSFGDIQAFYSADNPFGLANNLDGTVFVIENTSSQAISNGVLTISPPGGTVDSFNVGSIPAGGRAIIEPGISNDGGSGHTFFNVTGTLLDESESGPNGDNTQFEFTGTAGGDLIDTSVFTPAATKAPAESDPTDLINFLGGPNGNDGPSFDFASQVVATLTGTIPPLPAVTVAVPATSDPYLAGMPDGSTASSGDTAPAESPVIVSGLSIHGGDVLSFTATGLNSNSGAGPHDPPDGGFLINHFVGDQNGISGVTMPIDALLGVFLGPNEPDLQPSPPDLNFSSTGPDGQNYLTLSPALQQVFFIGDGRTSSGQVQHVIVPAGATRFILGTMDGQFWADNNGSFMVQVFDLGTAAPSAMVTHNLPASGYTVDPSTISPLPLSSSASQVAWGATSLGGSTSPSVFTLTGTVAGMSPGEVRQISLGTTIAVTTTTSGGQQFVDTINLPPLTVAAQHIIALAAASQDADKGTTLTYNVTLSNPLATEETYTLSTTGLNGFTTNLAASVPVPAGQTVTTPLTVSVPLSEPAGSLAFTVVAQTLEGGTDSTQGQVTVSPTVALPTEDVSVKLSPAHASAGPGTPVTYRVTVVNTGNVATTYTLGGTFPTGFTAAFSTPNVAVAPGPDGARTVLLTLTPPAGATAGDAPFSVSATSTDQSSVTASVHGTITVVNFGVGVVLSPTSAAPGATLTMTVTNLGSVSDTYKLALAGPAGATATLGSTQVTLAPGASQNVSIASSTLGFAVPGPVDLTAIATSQGNSSIHATASANIIAPTSHGLAAQLAPQTKILPIPGTTSFLLEVTNTGNAPDTYSAVISGTAGPIKASLKGLNGTPTQSIPLFDLPDLTSGALVINTDLTQFGQGTVTVKVQSLSDSSRTASATATVTAQQATTAIQVTAAPNPATFGQTITFTAVVADPAGQALPTGSVVFSVDGHAHPAVAIEDVGGKAVATLTASNLAPGAHSITATYAGATGFSPSGPVSTALTVNRDASSTKLSASPTTVNAGQSILLTATINADGPLGPTGSVTFKDGSTVLATVRLGSLTAGSIHGRQSGKTATVSLSIKLAAGRHDLSAVYTGDSHYRPSTGATAVQVNAPVAGDGPRVVAVSRFGIHAQPTSLVLTFNEPLALPTATDLSNYRIITVGGPGRGGNLHGRVTPIASVDYVPGSKTLILHPAQRLDVHNVYTLVVNGTTPGGLADPSGRLLDGTGSGRPGSNFVTDITLATLVRPLPPQAVDALAQAELISLKRHLRN